MSFKQCILNGIKEGLISEQQGETLYKNFDEIKDFYQYRKNLNKPEAEKKAAREVYDALKIEEAEKLRYTLQMRAKMNEIEFDFKNYRNSNGEVDTQMLIELTWLKITGLINLMLKTKQ